MMQISKKYKVKKITFFESFCEFLFENKAYQIRTKVEKLFEVNKYLYFHLKAFSFSVHRYLKAFTQF